jgi:surfactin synthase thioesterase subunit
MTTVGDDMDARPRRRRHGWSEAWVRQLSTGSASAGAVLCFPPAGGGASLFHAWLQYLPDDVELYLMQPPGREDRFGEPPSWDAYQAIDRTAEALDRHGTRLGVVFGHSLGALLAVHFMARHADTFGDARLVLSSAAPPGPGPAPEVDEALAVACIRATASGAHALASLPADMRAELELRWQADLRVQVSLGMPRCPPRDAVAVWAGEDDVVGSDELHAWTRILAVREFRRWPGSHEYPFSASTAPVVAELARLARLPPAPGETAVPTDHLEEV